MRFEQPHYVISPQGSIALNVYVDPVPTGGLFSYGVRLEPTSASNLVVEQITVPEALNFNGVLGPGAMTELSEESAGVKGTVNLENGNPTFYGDRLLATFQVRDLSGNEGTSTTLNLKFFNTLGPTETIFVNGLGNSLDNSIVFSGTTITVVPEPSAVGIMLIGTLTSLGAWKYKRRRNRAHSAFNLKFKP